jgi:hypothetical protein
LSLLVTLLFLQLFGKHLGSWHSCRVEEHAWLEPAICDLQLAPDLLPHKVHLVDRLHELLAHATVVLLAELLRVILTSVVAIEAVFQRERMRDLELLPSHDSASANLVWLDLEPAVANVEHVRLLSEDTRQQPDNCPTQEATIGSSVAPVEEGVLLFGVPVDVAVYPNLAALTLGDQFEQLLRVVDLWLKFCVRIDPLSIQIHPCNAVSVVTANNAVRVQAGNQNKRVKFSEKLGFFLVRC